MKNFSFLFLLLITNFFCATAQNNVSGVDSLIPSDLIKNGNISKTLKRQEWFWRPRTYAQTEIPSSRKLWREAESFKQVKASQRSINASNKWKTLGPSYSTNINGFFPGKGQGRLNCVTFHPTDSNTIWVGAASGGAWKSLDGGLTWSSNMDNMFNIGVSDIAIDPNNPSIIYLGTGDRDAFDTYSYGVLKSTDSGNTWDTTGLSFTLDQKRTVNRILINPVNSNIIIAATSTGIYYSSDYASNWIKVTDNENFVSMEFNPLNPNIIYSSTKGKAGFTAAAYKSLDGGQTWAKLTNGLPNNLNNGRSVIAVAPSDTSIIYSVFTYLNTIQGFYKSTNGGNSWTMISNNSVIVSNQAYYNLDIAISYFNPNQVFVGSVTIAETTDGGITWNQKSTNEMKYHADQHDLEFYPNSDILFAANDGGLQKTFDFGTNWVILNKGLEIQQVYRIANFNGDSSNVLLGAQDNGNSLYSNSEWKSYTGADGMDNVYDYNDPNTFYFSTQNGRFYKTTNGGYTYTSLNIYPSCPGCQGAWLSPIRMHPTNSRSLYVGFNFGLHKSTNGGTSWSPISPNFSKFIDFVSIAHSDTNVICLGTIDMLQRTTNGGGTWTNILSNLPNLALTDIEIHPSDPQKMWVSFSGYNSGNKVFETINGGMTWNNVSGSLPNVPVNCIEFRYNSDQEEIYIGTDFGVFMKDSTMTDWQSFNNNLPITIVNELEFHYASNKLRAATYSRGVWEIDLDPVTNDVPVANFTVSKTLVCAGDQIQFVSNSANGLQFRWEFPGGNPSVSTIENPVITYSAAGTYDVTLIVENSFGKDSSIRSGIVVVNPLPSGSISQSAFTICSGDAVQLTASGGVSYYWLGVTGSSQTSSTISMSPTIDMNYFVAIKDINNCAFIMSAVVKVNPLPTMTITPTYSYICPGGTASLQSTGALTYKWTPSASLNNSSSSSVIASPTSTTTYTVTGTNNFGCTKKMTTNVIVSSTNTAGISITPAATSICPGTNVALTASGGINYVWAASSSLNSTNGASVIASPVATTTYTVTGTNQGNCKGTKTVSVAISNNALPISVNYTTPLCTDSAILTASGANNYNWSPSTTLSSDTGSIVIASPTLTTTYTITGTNNNGCSGSKIFTLAKGNYITPYLTVSDTTSLCAGDSVVISAPGAYSYLWSNGKTSQSITAKYSGKYYVKIGDAAGCYSYSDTLNFKFSSYPQANITATKTQFCDGDSVIISAVPGYYYLWNNGLTTKDIITKTSDSFFVKITNDKGCTINSSTIEITKYSRPPADLSLTQTSFCYGDSSMITANPGYLYEWSSGENTQKISVKNSGDYWLKLINGSGCFSYSDTVAIDVYSLPNNNIIATDNSFCEGDSIIITADSGYSYSWSNALTTQAITVKETGEYFLTVTNIHGCSAFSDTININEFEYPPSEILASSIAICQLDSAIIQAASGYTYLWNTGENTQTISVDSGSYYFAEIFSGPGCKTISDTITISVNPLPVANIQASSISFCEGDSVTISVDSNDSYLWSNSSIAQTITVIDSGYYWVSLTTDVGCTTNSDTIHVNKFPFPSSSLTATSTEFCNGDSIIISAQPGFSYLWNTGSISQNIVVSSSGSYCLDITSGPGCKTSSDTVIVNSNPFPDKIITADKSFFCNGDSLTLIAPSAENYLWSNGLNSQTITIKDSGNYFVTVMNYPSCITLSDTLPVYEFPIPSVNINHSASTFCSGDSMLLSVDYFSDYLWNNGFNSQNIWIKNDGFYYVNIVDSNGCPSKSDSVLITEYFSVSPEITANRTTICSGDSVELSTAEFSDYEWSNGETTQSIVISTAGAYSVSVTDSNGCSNTSEEVNVQLAFADDLQIQLSGMNILNLGDSMILSIDSVFSEILWNTGDSARSIVIYSSGDYWVEALDSNGCNVTDTVQIFNVTAVNAAFESNSYIIYPNPNLGVFTIKGNSLFREKIQIVISNMIGEIIKVDSYVPDQDHFQAVIDLNGYAEGVYTIEMRQRQFVKILKAVIVK